MCDESRDDDDELLTKGINAERNVFDQCILPPLTLKLKLVLTEIL